MQAHTPLLLVVSCCGATATWFGFLGWETYSIFVIFSLFTYLEVKDSGRGQVVILQVSIPHWALCSSKDCTLKFFWPGLKPQLSSSKTLFDSFLVLPRLLFLSVPNTHFFAFFHLWGSGMCDGIPEDPGFQRGVLDPSFDCCTLPTSPTPILSHSPEHERCRMSSPLTFLQVSLASAGCLSTALARSRIENDRFSRGFPGHVFFPCESCSRLYRVARSGTGGSSGLNILLRPRERRAVMHPALLPWRWGSVRPLYRQHIPHHFKEDARESCRCQEPATSCSLYPISHRMDHFTISNDHPEQSITLKEGAQHATIYLTCLPILFTAIAIWKQIILKWTVHIYDLDNP